MSLASHIPHDLMMNTSLLQNHAYMIGRDEGIRNQSLTNIMIDYSPIYYKTSRAHPLLLVITCHDIVLVANISNCVTEHII